MTENTQKEIFANNLRNYMKLRGKRQADLVTRFKVSKSTASSWYNGAKLPRIEKIPEIAEWLGTTVTSLLWATSPADVIMYESGELKIEDMLQRMRPVSEDDLKRLEAILSDAPARDLTPAQSELLDLTAQLTDEDLAVLIAAAQAQLSSRKSRDGR